MKLRAVLLSALLFAFAHEAAALNSVTFGDYVVHYSAFNSTILTPQIAEAYAIPRNDARGVINIAVVRRVGGRTVPVDAEVKAVSTNGANKVREISLRRIQEGESIYHIAAFPIRHEEVVDFQVSVRPLDSATTFDFAFRQQFFKELH